jgi:hypothetical protein
VLHTEEEREDQIVLVLQVPQDGGDLLLGTDVDLVVVRGGEAILLPLSVLAHHDDRRGVPVAIRTTASATSLAGAAAGTNPQIGGIGQANRRVSGPA